MMVQLIWGISTIGSIVFGVIAMMLLLDVHIADMTPIKRRVFCIGVFVVFLSNFLIVFIFGIEHQAKYYMLLVHLPLEIIFWISTGIHPIKILFTLFTAVFLIFPANLASNLIARFVIEPFRCLASIFFFMMLFGMILLIDKYLKKDFNYLIKHYSSNNFLKLFFLPLSYNISIYWIGRYNYSLTTPIDNLIFRGLLFIVAFVAYLLLLDIARTDREKQTMLHNQTILSLNLESASRQMAFLHTTQEQTTIYRHDMRHHLALLSGFAAEGDVNKIKEYISRASSDIDAITPMRYCENETVNLILASFDAMAKKERVALCTEVTLPHELNIDDIELCSLLSNSLDNAITASAQLDNDKLRKVYIRALISRDKLLISTENAYVGKIEMSGELPKSQKKESGHGFGIKSMISIVERHGGLYSFETSDGLFVLQLMIPLEQEIKK